MQTLFILFGIFILIQIFLNIWLRKKLEVRKKDWFSYNHVNKLHKWLDWSLRLVMVFVLPISYFIPFTVETNEYAGLPFIILMVYFILDGLLRTFMEWKYYPGRKDYIVTLINTIVLFFFICMFYIWIINQF
ncbi:DUF4181 domain-containing protein [Paraliobacillus sp. X-1268]|uniref:DUF4181 domain-containing protein n=1 Tax=Paraliobacillus sp. X-1268 TaxID=2213193 RepID=UPI000E3D1400|nr:DUF4181 domain-containing protein [Paraliobacillus sp. X-1268]